MQGPLVGGLLALALLLPVWNTHAVVIRDDVPDREYRIEASAFPALADLPGEGHGVLIAPGWIVTAGHAVAWQDQISTVDVGGKPIAVRQVVVHPGYRSPPSEVVERALATGDWEAFFDILAASDDLALIQLAEPVGDIRPVAIHRSPDPGDVVRIMGRGATGNGTSGYPHQASRRNELRHGYNLLSLSEGRWIAYRFDAPPTAHPHEATTGSGDSGGPILVADGDGWHLAGIAAWKRSQVVGTEVLQGRYGETSYGVRLVHYLDWIEETIAAGTPTD